MKKLISAVLCLVFSSLVGGCQTQPTDPSVAGDWSEPINGVRMMAMPIADSPYVTGSRTVLIFTQNVGDQSIHVPEINPTPVVTVRPNDRHRFEQPRLSGNLRIQIESAEDEGIHLPQYQFDQLREMQQLNSGLMPGQIRVFALILNTSESPLMQMQQRQNCGIQTAMSQWPISNHEPHRYRMYLSYRPAGFEPMSENQRREASERRWADQQIDLPPFEMTVSSINRNRQ